MIQQCQDFRILPDVQHSMSILSAKKPLRPSGVPNVSGHGVGSARDFGSGHDFRSGHNVRSGHEANHSQNQHQFHSQFETDAISALIPDELLSESNDLSTYLKATIQELRNNNTALTRLATQQQRIT